MIRSDIYVKWELSPRVIVIPIPSTELVIQDLVDTCRELEYETIALSEPSLLSVSGKDSLGGGTQVGLTAALNNAVILFEPRTTPLVSGTSQEDTTGLVLVDPSGNFIINNIYPGCSIVNNTTGAKTTVIGVTSATQLSHLILSGGSRSTWLSTDSYSIFPNDQCNISGGNLVANDINGYSMSPIMASINTQIVKTSSASATLQQLTEVQQAAFGNMITVDQTNGFSGTEYPIGTLQKPSNNITEAKAIAIARGIDTFHIIGNCFILSTDIISGYNFTGNGVEFTKLYLGATATTQATAPVVTSKTTFKDMSVKGWQDGETHYYGCEILALKGVHCKFLDCLLVGPMTMEEGAYADTTVLINCYTGWDRTVVSPALNDEFIVDLNNSSINMAFNNFNGKMKFINLNRASAGTVAVNMVAGKITVDSTCTTGAIKVRGSGQLLDQSGGTVVDNDIAAILIKETLQPELNRINQIPVSSEMATLIQNNSVGVNGGLTSAQMIMLTEIYNLMGLDPTKPLIVNQTGRTAGVIDQHIDINDTTKTTTVTRVDDGGILTDEAGNILIEG